MCVSWRRKTEVENSNFYVPPISASSSLEEKYSSIFWKIIRQHYGISCLLLFKETILDILYYADGQVRCYLSRIFAQLELNQCWF